MPRDPAETRKGPWLKKHLGQHHLTDSRLVAPLVDFLAPAGRRVVEIGPGGGVLTAPLLEAGGRVLAVELDLEWLFELRRRVLPGLGRLTLVGGDALDFPWEQLPVGSLVAGNLPYNVATPILERLLPHHGTVERAGFLLQKEVAERLVAGPGDPAYGALSVLSRLHSRARILGKVKPGSFRPPPKVDSAFVGFELRAPPLGAEQLATFERLVRAAFRQRRKKLRNNLRALWGEERSDAVLLAAGISGDVRAEELSIEALLGLFETSASL